MPFFNRIECDKIVFQTRFLSFLLVCWTPIIAISVVGYCNFGIDFFSYYHWVNNESTRFHPIISIFIVFVVISLIIFSNVDLFLASRCYVGIKNGDLIIMGRMKYEISDLDIDRIRIGGLFKNIIFIDSKKSNSYISIPLIKANISRNFAVEKLKMALLENSDRN